MPQIVWDAFGLQSIYAGIGQYAWKLAQVLQREGRPPTIIPSVAVDAHFSDMVYGPSPKPRRSIKPLALLKSARLFHDFCQAQDKVRPTIFHGLSNYNLPKLKPYPALHCVLSLHDLIPILDRTAASSSLRAYLQWQLPKSFERADLILCNSEWTLQSVAEHFPEARGKLAKLSLGAVETFRASRGGGNKRQLLTIARGESYKRLPLIHGLLQHLPEAYSYNLVTDKKGKAILEALGSDPRLQIFTAIDAVALERIWDSTDLYVHPSLWEGYGLPIAEAIAHGVPSLVCEGSATTEVLGNAGCSLAPDAGAEAWAAKLEAMLKEDWRARCHARWTALPTWDDVGKQLLDFYDNLKQSSNP